MSSISKVQTANHTSTLAWSDIPRGKLFAMVVISIMTFVSLTLTAFADDTRDICSPRSVDAYKPKAVTLSAPRFDWSVPQRYGIDAGKDMPLLPNTLEYVMNWEAQDGSTENACPCTEYLNEVCIQKGPKFKVSFKALSPVNTSEWVRKSRQEIEAEFAARGCPNPAESASGLLSVTTANPEMWYYWNIRTQTKIANAFEPGESWVRSDETVKSRGANPSICLPQGTHRVSFSASPREASGKLNTTAEITTRTIEVKDHLIVSLGDSFGAGEGAPERPKQPNTTQWAKAVHSDDLRDNAKQLQRAYDRIPTEISIFDCKTLYKAMSARERRLLNHFDNFRGHRSSLNQSSQLALEIEAKSDKTSVTYINLAQTGATISKGVLGSYGGSDKAELEAGFTLPPEELDIRFRTSGMVAGTSVELDPYIAFTCPQIEILENIRGKRVPDEIVLSVGGNDAGFANVITAMYLAWDELSITDDSDQYSTTGRGRCKGTEGTICKMLYALWNGDWEWEFENFIELGGITDSSVLGLDGLSAGYETLADKLAENFSASTVTLISPGFFGRGLEGTVSGSLKGNEYSKINSISGEFETLDGSDDSLKLFTEYCFVHTKAPFPLVGDLHITPQEFKIAYHEVYKPLLQVMENAASKHGWKFLEHNEINTAAIGICNGFTYSEERGPNGTRAGKGANEGFPPRHPQKLAVNFIRGFRTTSDSNRFQHGDLDEPGVTKGQFHPNEYGYAYTKSLLTKLALPLYIDGLTKNADKNDTVSEVAVKRLQARSVPNQMISNRRGAFQYLPDVQRETENTSSRLPKLLTAVNGNSIIELKAGTRVVAVPDKLEVDLYPLFVPKGNTVTIETSADSNRDIYKAGNCGMISVYNVAGGLVATNSPLLGHENSIAKAEMKGRDVTWSEPIGPCVDGRRVSEVDPGSIVFGREDQKRKSDPKTSQLTFENLCNDEQYFIAFSDQNHVLFDPIVGTDKLNGETRLGSANIKTMQIETRMSPAGKSCSASGSAASPNADREKQK
ncbi:MAG: hypothetical protein AAF583_07310 [Pseudomonadota bacterium]